MDEFAKLQDFINDHRAGLPPVTDLDEPLQFDSLAFIRATAYLDNDLGIRVEDEEYTVDNFVTLRAIRSFIAAKNATAAQGLITPLKIEEN